MSTSLSFPYTSVPGTRFPFCVCGLLVFCDLSLRHFRAHFALSHSVSFLSLSADRLPLFAYVVFAKTFHPPGRISATLFYFPLSYILPPTTVMVFDAEMPTCFLKALFIQCCDAFLRRSYSPALHASTLHGPSQECVLRGFPLPLVTLTTSLLVGTILKSPSRTAFLQREGPCRIPFFPCFPTKIFSGFFFSFFAYLIDSSCPVPTCLSAEIIEGTIGFRRWKRSYFFYIFSSDFSNFVSLSLQTILLAGGPEV